eukprot:s272_g24.t1
MSLVESNAAFVQRCGEMDTTGNLSTLSRTVYGAGATLGQTGMLRRLHFEATTLMIAAVKQRVDNEAADKGDSVKRIPIAEKRYRQEQQAGRLAGVNISGELEPSHQLLDLTNNILESGAITWIAPSRCTKRSDEVQQAIKDRPSAVQVENQQLRVAQLPDEFKADCGSEIKLQWCWQRRGLAMDQCRLVSWAVHEAWVQQLFQTLSQQPPPGFQHVSMQQLIRADRELWTLLAQECKGSLKPNATGDIPLDAKIKTLSRDPRVSMFILPLPASARQADTKEAAPKKTAAPSNPQQAAAKGAANKRRRTSRADKSCPEELKKYQLRCEHGPVCWAYNLKTGGKRSVSQMVTSETEEPPKKVGRGSGRDVQHTGQTSPKISPKTSQPSNVGVADECNAAQRKKFTGKLLNDMIFVEICAGSAKLTKAAREAGFNGLAVDHTDKRSCGIDICIFELEDQQQVDDLCNFLEEQADNIAAVWIAPSCGTASKARERKVPMLRRLGITEPIPLRSKECPDQIDGLDGTNKLKVEKANLLYDAVEQILRTTCRAHIFTGSRDKLTSVWVNEDWLDTLEARCDKSHPHKSWKVTLDGNAIHFPTSDEAAYPQVLCQRIIACVLQKALHFGALVSTSLEQQLEQPDADAAGRIALGALPRGAKVRPLVAEYGNYKAVVAPTQQTQQVEQFISTWPKGSKITSRQLWKRGALRVENQNCYFLAGADQVGPDEMVELCWVGIPSDPDEFVARALFAGHPRSLDVHVDDAMRDVVKLNLIDPPYILAKKRVQFIKKWTARASETKVQEEKLRESMPEHAKQVLGNKRLVLFGEMLKDLNYPDTKLVEDISTGFRLSGYMTKSNVFRARSKRPAMSLSTLVKLSKSFNLKNVTSLSNRQEAELEQETWKETEAELSKGWIFLDDTGSLEGKFLGKRFGLRQGQKIRVIDDCTCCGLNLTVGLHEKFRLHSVDFLAALFGFALKLCPPDLRPVIRGRTYDLKSAYKQFPIHADDRASLRMGVNIPNCDKFATIGFNSLPFGAVGSVAGFLRISQAIWYIGYFGLGLLWSAFYDDYTLLSRAELESSSSWSCETLLDLLGMQYAKEGHKCVPFCDKFKTLGLEVDTKPFQEGKVLVGHTESRRSELGEHISTILESGVLSPKEAERLRGRMIFFEGYSFGRVANAAVKSLGRFCQGPSTSRPLDDDLRKSLQFLRDRVAMSRPLQIERALHTTWLVFTDGACDQEKQSGSVGGVIYSPSGECLHFFGEEVPTHIMRDLFERSNNPIHELEVLPVLIAADLWGQMYSHAQVVYYIDNESSRMAHIRGTGETLRANLMIDMFVRLEADLQHKVWFGRVPSFSNPSDSPSRLEFEHIMSLGATRTSIDWEKVCSHLGLRNGAELGRC